MRCCNGSLVESSGCHCRAIAVIRSATICTSTYLIILLPWNQDPLNGDHTILLIQMKPYDWIIVGGGITGAALSYELVKNGFSVLLLEQQVPLKGATRYSYGGLAYWSGTTALTRQLCTEGIKCYRTLANELEAETQFRELDLLLTIPHDKDPEEVAVTYAQFAIPPKLLSVQAACILEPLLNPAAITGALTVKHGLFIQRSPPKAIGKRFSGLEVRCS